MAFIDRYKLNCNFEPRGGTHFHMSTYATGQEGDSITRPEQALRGLNRPLDRNISEAGQLDVEARMLQERDRNISGSRICFLDYDKE
jgi:hypothetical protein